jgi:hypothetical protein
MATRTEKVEEVLPPVTKLLGEQRMERLALVKPNDWNPNRVPEHKLESIKESLINDGWLQSQPLLIWESDEKGKIKNIIIDGEHRHRMGTALGLETAPMVFIKRVSKAYAMSLTVKLDNNRGSFEDQPLAKVLRELMPTLEVDDLAKTLGFTQLEMNKLLALPEISLDGVGNPEEAGGRKGGPMAGGIVSQNAITKMVPLYFDKEAKETFDHRVQVIGEKYSLDNVTDVMTFVLNKYWDSFEAPKGSEG